MPLGSYNVNGIAKLLEARPAKTVTAVNQAQISTARSKFGGASALFDGSGDYLSIGSSADFNFGTGDFTIEAQIYIAGNANANNSGNRDACVFSIVDNSFGTWGALVILGSSSTTGTGIQLYKNQNTETNITATTTVSQSTWHHVAVSRSGSSVRIFLNGTQVGSTATSSTAWGVDNREIRIGRLWDASFNDDWNGNIDELRISNSARYTANFTAPTAAFTNDANTVLLLHMNGTNGSTTFTDDNS